MLRFILALTCLFGPMVAVAQTDADMLESAKLGLIEKMHASSGERLREMLVGKGHSDDEVNDLLFDAFEKSATCIVTAARDQAIEQALPVSIILAGIGHKTRGKEDSRLLLELDIEALKVKTRQCSRSMMEGLGLAPL